MADHTEDSRLFDQQIHDAYERVELGEDAQERMLAELLVAQRETQAGRYMAQVDVGMQVTPVDAGTQTAPAHAGTRSDDSSLRRKSRPTPRSDVRAKRGEVIPFGPRQHTWRRVLPLAAVVLAGLVVVAVSARSGEGRATSAVSQDEAAATTAAPESSVDYDESAGGAAAVNTLADGAAVADAVRMVDGYPYIVLGEGMIDGASGLAVWLAGEAPVEVDASELGDSLGTAWAMPADRVGDIIACEVYTIAGSSDTYAVRFDGETTYWLCIVE